MTTTEKLIIGFLSLAIIFSVVELNNALQVNTKLKDAIDNRGRVWSSLQVIDSYPSQNTLTVVDGKGYQRTASQYHAQKALNHDGSKLVQVSPKNQHVKYQYTNNNYFDKPVQKTAQMYQGKMTDVNFKAPVEPSSPLIKAIDYFTKPVVITGQF
jgi:hypothetical protein